MALVGIHVPNSGGSPNSITGVPYDVVMNTMLGVGYEAYFGVHWDLDFLYRAALSYPGSLREIRWGEEPGGVIPFDAEPAALADYIATWYVTEKTAPMGVTPIDYVTRHCTGNEPNLEGRFKGYPQQGIPARWADLNEWLVEHYTRLRQNLLGTRNFRLHFPALAPTGGDEYQGIRTCRNAISQCDVLDIHCYGPAKWEWRGVSGGGWHRNPHYDSNWPTNANYGSTFMRYRQELDTMGFKNMPINITEYNRAWYDRAWFESLHDINREAYLQYPYPEEYQDAVDFANETIEFHKHLDRNRSRFKLMSACGFLWASGTDGSPVDVIDRFRAFAWMRKDIIEPVVEAQRSYIVDPRRPIDEGAGRGAVWPLLIGGVAAVGMVVASKKGMLG